MYAIMDTKKDQFAWVDWMIAERQKYGWSQSDLARRAKATRQTINDYEMRRRVEPDEKILARISIALSYPPDHLPRLANLLPPEPLETKLTRQITHLTNQLPTQEQEDILEFIKFRLRLAEERGKYETKKSVKQSGSAK